ncbi:hypothetical protein ACHAXS_007838 [Conticribra weissflogii]
MADEPNDASTPTCSQQSWTERIRIVPLTTSNASPSGEPINSDDDLEFNVASFNILAESYLTPRSHPGLPADYSAVAFDPDKRQRLLLDTLRGFCCPPNDSGGVAASEDPLASSATSGAKSQKIKTANIIHWETHKKWDILCLQELEILPRDRDLLLPAFESWGYELVRTPNDQRVDGSAIIFDASKFRLVDSEIVRFDDLADLKNLEGNPFQDEYNNNVDERRNDDQNDKLSDLNAENTEDETRKSHTQSQQMQSSSPTGRGKRKKNNKHATNTTSAPMELTGMVRSFLRRNCAIVARLESTTAPSNTVGNNKSHQFLVASAHLYWHPGYEYVKLCQAKYLLDRIHAMATRTIGGMDDKSISYASTGNETKIPVVICGDTNSKPGSIVHQLFTKSSVDARQVAPWHYFYDAENEVMYSEKEEGNDALSMHDRLDGQDNILTDGVSKSASDKTFFEKASPVNGASNHLRVEKAVSSQLEYLSDQRNGLPAEFTALCGVIDPNNESQPPPPIALGPQQTIDSVNRSEKDRSYGIDMDDVEATLASRRLGNHISPQDYQHSTPPMPVKYLLDYTLNRFTRWLRILGIDATLETEEEEKERTSNGKIAIFDHCKREKRTLITTSYKLLLRKDCPPGAYLLDPKSTTILEQALVRLLRTHGVELSPRVFLTRCVVCNGHIHRVLTDDEKRNVFIEHGAPDLVNSKDDMEVFRCDGCGQGYWWDDRPSSSASRVFVQATKLLRLCLRGGVRVKDEDSSDKTMRKEVMGAFDFVDVQKERAKGIAGGFVSMENELCIIKWLREERLSNPFRLRSAYALSDNVGEELSFSNVTREFVGLLDYVFYDTSSFEQVGKLYVPKSFRELNTDGIVNGHLIPSNRWPSDHLAVGARLRLKRKNYDGNTASRNGDGKAASAKSPTSNTDVPTHPPRCSCGCVPQIFSLFEMAEMRKKARERAKAEAAAN